MVVDQVEQQNFVTKFFPMAKFAFRHFYHQKYCSLDERIIQI